MADSYVTLADFESGILPASSLAGVPMLVQQRMLERASSLASSFLIDRYPMPLCRPFDPALQEAVMQIVAYWALQRRGLNPQANGADYEVARNSYLDAMSWLKLVANGQASVVCARSPEGPSLQPDVDSNVPRFYGAFGRPPGSQNYPSGGGIGGGWGT